MDTPTFIAVKINKRTRIHIQSQIIELVQEIFPNRVTVSAPSRYLKFENLTNGLDTIKKLQSNVDDIIIHYSLIRDPYSPYKILFR